MSIKIENVDVYGLEAAIRGMRSPLNSWEKSDSGWEFVEDPSPINPNDEFKFVIGKNDLTLLQRLAKSGSDHRKFMRQIFVSCDITAPLYWWKQADQYKVGTVTNSCSTMHTIAKKQFDVSDFSCEHLNEMMREALDDTIYYLNKFRWYYNEWDNIDQDAKDSVGLKDRKDAWWQMIQTLPTSYNQKRTWTANYEVLFNIYYARRAHKLDEWRTFCGWIETLPYAKELITEVKADA